MADDPASRVPPKSTDWLNRKQAAAYLRARGCVVSARTLALLAMHNNRKKGPPFMRTLERNVAYAKPDLDAWAEQATVRIA